MKNENIKVVWSHFYGRWCPNDPVAGEYLVTGLDRDGSKVRVSVTEGQGGSGVWLTVRVGWSVVKRGRARKATSLRSPEVVERIYQLLEGLDFLK